MLPRGILIVCCLFLLTMSASRAHAGPLEDAARNAGRPLIVRFGLDRCLQCGRQAKAFDEIAPHFEGQIDFRFVHIGKEENLAAHYKILLIPTVIFFDVGGSEIFRNVGLFDAQELVAKFRDLGLIPPEQG
jgi:thiol-disulfide isomerase/thioredoxin